jgi:type IV pilus assembly protein PilV
MLNLKYNNSKNTKGYLMIEVLVALIIFSVSLISLLALQLNSYSATQSASYRNIATNYANDFLDKMRANKDSVINGTYITVNPANNNCRSVNFNSINAYTSCTSTQMAQDDLLELNSQVAASLPQGVAVVCLDSSQAQGTPTAPNCDGLGNMYAIKIFWKDSRSKLLNTNSGFSQVIIGGEI